MPIEQTIIAGTALLAGLLIVAIMLAGRRVTAPEHQQRTLEIGSRTSHATTAGVDDRAPATTLRVVWWLTITIVLLGVGISGSFAADQAPIFLLGGAAVATVVIFHELLGSGTDARILRFAEAVAAVVLIAGLLALTGFASSPFAMLFALVSVAAALAYGPRAGATAVVLGTMAFGVVLFGDPRLTTYGADDVLQLSIGLGATWLLAFVAIAYAGRQRRAMARAIEQARTDPLTSLFNRAQLHVTLDQEVSRTRRSDRGFCVLMIDLDGLKAINDEGGHLRGDEVLRALGRVIHHSIRTVDSAYRYGGDEFVVLLPETDIVGAFVVAEKIRAGAEEVGLAMNEVGPDPLTSVSIGLVSHPEDGLSGEELMAAADRAMYQAKRLGKNQISGNPRPRPALLSRRAPDVVEAAAPAAPDRESSSPKRAAPTAPVAPRADRAFAVELGPVIVDEAPSPPKEEEEDDADPQEVRRRIVSASRSFDPDHQIRRAMDAFLSPTAPDADRPTPDH
ncbi:MAG: GGDEF domain-containing protein [Candidatus Limnocylindria bacterium]